jgi:predicted RNase H-like HicB family nuclease
MLKRLAIKRRSGAMPEQLIIRIDIERETDGRWIVEAVDLPGVMAYGATKQEAIDHAATLALHVFDDRMEHGEAIPDLDPDDVLDHVYHHHV